LDSQTREILHLARLLNRIVEDMPSEKIDRYIVRDAQRVIEAIETLVRMHTAPGRGYLRSRVVSGPSLATHLSIPAQTRYAIDKQEVVDPLIFPKFPHALSVAELLGQLCVSGAEGLSEAESAHGESISARIPSPRGVQPACCACWCTSSGVQSSIS
jgi:hypothetical protein